MSETPDPRPTETKEQFLARYPDPSARGRTPRQLVQCRCPYQNACTGWAWASDELDPWETPVEEQS